MTTNDNDIIEGIGNEVLWSISGILGLTVGSYFICKRCMYRKHLKMARGEGESGIRSNFVERVVKLPMVHVAWDYATNTYAHIKESNKLVNFTLTNAEKSVTFVAGQAKPVVMKFEKQIQAVDNLACKGLGTLEEKVPFITKPADEIITDTRNLYVNTVWVWSRYEELKKYGTDKVKSVADFSLEKANAILGKEVVDSLLNSVDGALVITEMYIDRFLPPTEDEKKKDGKVETKSGVSRLINLPNKILHRSYRSLALRFEYAQEKGIEFLLYPIGVIELSKGYVENILQFVLHAWGSLKQQSSDTDDAEKSTVLSTVRDRALWIVGVIRVIPQLLPMYIYGFVSWLNEQRGKNEDRITGTKEEAKQNGEVKQHNSTNNCANSTKSREPNCHSNHHGGNDAS